MTDHSISRPPRLVPDQSFPRYAYIPGQTPHPTRDPAGHSYGARPASSRPPDPENWQACRDYLYGIDLFNHGYYWEAHEAWEGLWVACGRRGLTAQFLQALINLAATGFKARWGSARGMKANAETTTYLFKSVMRRIESSRLHHMGLDVRLLGDYANSIAKRPLTDKAAASDRELLSFDLFLWPA